MEVSPSPLSSRASRGICGAPRLPLKGLGFVSSHTDSSGLGSHGKPGQVRLAGRPSGPRERRRSLLRLSRARTHEALALPALKRVMRVETLSRSAKALLPPHKCGAPSFETNRSESSSSCIRSSTLRKRCFGKRRVAFVVGCRTERDTNNNGFASSVNMDSTRSELRSPSIAAPLIRLSISCRRKASSVPSATLLMT